MISYLEELEEFWPASSCQLMRSLDGYQMISYLEELEEFWPASSCQLMRSLDGYQMISYLPGGTWGVLSLQLPAHA